MEQYISKSALAAEIERRLDKLANTSAENNREYSAIIGAQHYELISLVQYINTLEVKEVNLEDDVDKILEANDWNFDKIDFYQFAKHFFELGLKAHKVE